MDRRGARRRGEPGRGEVVTPSGDNDRMIADDPARERRERGRREAERAARRPPAGKSYSEPYEMACEALERCTDALTVLKALVKAEPEELPADLSRAINVVNDGYAQAVTTLAALGRRPQPIEERDGA